MKKLQLIVTLGFILLLCQSVQAQWAGPDPVVVRKPDNTQKAVIGPADDTQDASYHWEGPHIFSQNHNNPQIVINPQVDGEVYTVTRVTACGEEQDEVVVRMKEHPTLKSVTPRVQCYSQGDPIEVSDFVIVTEPTGYEWMVTVSPNNAPNIGLNIIDYNETVTLTFSLNHEGYITTKTASVNVYNDNLVTNYGAAFDIAGTYRTCYRYCEKLFGDFDWFKQKIEECDKFDDVLGTLFGPTVTSIYRPIFSVTGDIPIFPDNVALFHTCCNGETVSGYSVNSGVFYAELGGELNFPTSFSLPGTGGLFINLKWLIGGSAGPVNIVYKGKCTNANVPLALYVDVEGGVKVMLLSDDIFSANLSLGCRAQTSWNWDFNKEIKMHPLDVDLSIRGKVKSFGLFSWSVNYPIGSWQFFND